MSLAILGALIIGLTLGLLGSGGSILTVPVLVYVLGHNGKVAIAESLAIVGGIALAGMLPYARARQVDWRNVVFFGLPGMVGTYGGAWLAKFISGPAQLVLFGGVMLAAAGMMFRKARGTASPSTDEFKHPLWQVMVEGAAVGVMTGVVGVGGGFLIVPALVILGRLPMRLAVGTSLAVVSLNSGIGFLKYLGALRDLQLAVDWHTIAVFLAVGVAGSLVGNALGARMNQQVLRKVFAVFLVAMGLFVVAREAPHIMRMAQGSVWRTQHERRRNHPRSAGRVVCPQYLGAPQTGGPDLNERPLRGGTALRTRDETATVAGRSARAGDRQSRSG